MSKHFVINMRQVKSDNASWIFIPFKNCPQLNMCSSNLQNWTCRVKLIKTPTCMLVSRVFTFLLTTVPFSESKLVLRKVPLWLIKRVNEWVHLCKRLTKIAQIWNIRKMRATMEEWKIHMNNMKFLSQNWH